MFVRGSRSLDQQNTQRLPPIPPTRPPPSTPSLRQLFTKKATQADKDAAKARVKQLVGNALSLLRTAATLAADAAGDAAVPCLSIGLQALATVLEKIEAMGSTVEGLEALATRIAELCAAIEQLLARSCSLPQGMQERIDELVRTWADIGERAKKIKSRGRLARFVTSNADAKALEGLVEEINTSIQDKIMAQGILKIEITVAEVNENMHTALQGISEVHASVKAIPILLDASFIPTYAKKAQYDAGGTVRRECLDGTRTALLKQLQDWISVACTRKDLLHIDGLGSVWWINGLAGTGKTTIAYSIALWAKRQGLLGGSFFCSRFDEQCSNPSLVFVTISRQLCSFHEPFKEQVMKVLRNGSDVLDSGAARQFEELIVGPLEALKALGESFPPCLLVFDALDECNNEASTGGPATSTVMTVVAKFMPRVEPFLTFLFTSRPEPAIARLFNGPRAEMLEGVTIPVVLHKIELQLVEGDIRKCVVHGFEQIREEYDVPQDWPPPHAVDKLVQLAGGLFILATTAVAFVRDQAYRNPTKQLERLSSINTATGPSTTILNTLYSDIIAASYDKISRELADGLQKVLCAIAPAQEPLSVSDLASLLDFSEGDITNILSGLHSVLHIPAEPNEPILVIHPTFPEFLLRTREATAATSVPTPIEFYIPAQQHWFLFSRCLDAVATLKRDIVNIRYPAKFKSEIDDFSERVRSAVPPHVRHACRCWSFYFRKGAVRSEEVDGSRQLHIFMYGGLLVWVEACILLNIPTPPMLDTASNGCRTLGGAFSDLVPLLADCRRFVQTHSSVMHTTPLQLYHFALSIAPANSPVRDLYRRELDHSIIVCRGAPSHWPPCLDTIVAHGGKRVFSVTFSTDGKCFASGGQDNTLRIRDTATRTELRSFDGHTRDVNCVAFSPDGAYVASGSGDKTACIWQVSTGNRVHTLEHTGRVSSVAYSADGGRILSANQWGEVNLWDTADGRCVFTLEQTGNWTWQATLSPDGNVIARGEGASLALHYVSSATHEALDLPDQVRACAFSPDGHYVAARTEHAIRVWANADKALVRSIDMPDSDLMSRLAFSRDGKYIACGSRSGAVYVWQVTSEDPQHTLNGHTGMVQDIAWTPDRLQLASTSDDGTIRLWDGALHSPVIDTSAKSEHQPVLPDAAGPPRFALIRYQDHSTHLHLPSLGIEHFPVDPQSPEGAPVVATFTDIVAACDAACEYGDLSPSAGHWAFLTGQQSAKLHWRPVAISQDGSLMAYVSPTSDESVDVCNLHTGAVVATLQGHTRDVLSFVFSPDGTRLATGSWDNTVKVWDAATGILVGSHAEHQEWVRATAFSSDGRFVASGSDDWTVCIFEIVTERVVHVLGSTHDWVMEVTFTMDNQHIIALDHSNKVFIWEAASGARIHSFSFRDEGWRRSLTFSSNTLGIRVHGDAGDSTISLRRATIWAVNFYESDGWLYAWLLGATHRLCGLPAEWRDVMGSYGDVVCLREAKSGAHPRGRTIVLDMSRILAYVESLGPDNL